MDVELGYVSQIIYLFLLIQMFGGYIVGKRHELFTHKHANNCPP